MALINNLVEIKRDTHIVIKNEDVEKYLSPRQKRKLKRILNTINTGRVIDGKKINHYAVCNEDEPYYKKVMNIILEGETTKNKGV